MPKVWRECLNAYLHTEYINNWCLFSATRMRTLFSPMHDYLWPYMPIEHIFPDLCIRNKTRSSTMARKPSNTDHVISFKNKKAAFEYFLMDEFTAGIQLTGTEIKSIRDGKVSFVDAYCLFENNELYVKGLHISEYRLGTHYNHDPRRDRKLLLTKREMRKLMARSNEKGYTIIPVMLFINEKGLAKLKIALARGKHMYDKRETIKKKDIQREYERSGDQ